MKRAGWVLLPILTFLAGAAAMAGWHARQAQRAEARQASALGGARIDLVVDVGDVADIGDMFLAVDMTQQAKQHVEYDDGARIADMGKVVDGRSAHIHAYASGIDRRECPLLACQRIVEPEFHSK